MSASFTPSDLELTGLSVISRDKMRELEIENDDDDDGGGDDGNVSNLAEHNDQFMAAYCLQNEVAVAAHKTYVLHLNASV
jgi:hypothetical protein